MVLALGVVAPVGVLDPAHQVARVGEGRTPAPVDQHGVPADVVDVQVGAQHGVDRLARVAGGGKIGEERAVQVVPGRNAATLLVVAEAGVDHDAPRGGFDHQGVDAHAQAARFIGEMRAQPADGQDGLARGVGQDEAAAAGGFQLDDAGDEDVADAPGQHGEVPAGPRGADPSAIGGRGEAGPGAGIFTSTRAWRPPLPARRPPAGARHAPFSLFMGWIPRLSHRPPSPPPGAPRSPHPARRPPARARRAPFSLFMGLSPNSQIGRHSPRQAHPGHPSQHAARPPVRSTRRSHCSWV